MHAIVIGFPPLVAIVPVPIALAPNAAPIRSTFATVQSTPPTAFVGPPTAMKVLLALGATLSVAPVIAVPSAPIPIVAASLTAVARARWRPTRRVIPLAVPTPITGRTVGRRA